VKETHPFDRPTENSCLEVLRLSKLTTLEDSDRVNDAQPSVKFTTWDGVIHTLTND
jgi:hypothetical protein